MAILAYLGAMVDSILGFSALTSTNVDTLQCEEAAVLKFAKLCRLPNEVLE
jgi:hypothetical protein